MLVFKDITARHSGKYTCFARNSAAKVNYTAEMLVRGICAIDICLFCFVFFFFRLSVLFMARSHLFSCMRARFEIFRTFFSRHCLLG